MPQMGESVTEGTIVRWLKKVGDGVDRDEPLFEISTDKVDAEIPSPVAGVLIEIRVHEGETVAVDTVVATVGAAGEMPADAPPAPSQTSTPAPPAQSRDPREAGPPATPVATRGAQNRRFVIAGRYCEHVFAEIGAADREESLPAGGNAPAAAGKRYYYEPQSGDPSMRTVFSCIDGRVADVERTLVR